MGQHWAAQNILQDDSFTSKYSCWRYLLLPPSATAVTAATPVWLGSPEKLVTSCGVWINSSVVATSTTRATMAHVDWIIRRQINRSRRKVRSYRMKRRGMSWALVFPHIIWIGSMQKSLSSYASIARSVLVPWWSISVVSRVMSWTWNSSLSSWFA